MAEKALQSTAILLHSIAAGELDGRVSTKEKTKWKWSRQLTFAWSAGGFHAKWKFQKLTGFRCFYLLGISGIRFFLCSSAIKFKEYERTVTVKGLSEREYPADIAIWPIQFSVANNDLTQLYESIEKDANEIIHFLKANGFEEDEMNASPPGIGDKLAQGYEKSKIEFRYHAIQTITVYSKKIQHVRSTMNKLAELGKKGSCLRKAVIKIPRSIFLPGWMKLNRAWLKRQLQKPEKWPENLQRIRTADWEKSKGKPGPVLNKR